MTLPSLIQNYKKSVASARLKKFVSFTNQALTYAELDLGPREDWSGFGEMGSSDSAEDFINTYLKPYMKNLGIKKRNLLGLNMATLRLVDGSQISVKIGSCADFYYDINGEKKPNELGRDIFPFILCRKKEDCNLNSNNLQAFYCSTTPISEYTREKIIQSCIKSGTLCTILLEQNGYEFPDDYPRRL